MAEASPATPNVPTTKRISNAASDAAKNAQKVASDVGKAANDTATYVALTWDPTTAATLDLRVGFAVGDDVCDVSQGRQRCGGALG